MYTIMHGLLLVDGFTVKGELCRAHPLYLVDS